MTFEETVKDVNHYWEIQDEYKASLRERDKAYMPYAVRVYFRQKHNSDVLVIKQNKGIEAFAQYKAFKRLIEEGFIVNVHHIEITNIDKTIVRKFYVENLRIVNIEIAKWRKQTDEVYLRC